MTAGARAALLGVMSALNPKLAIEIGRAEGRSPASIAAHSLELQSFDIVEPSLEPDRFSNVILQTGNSRELLPEVLRRFEHEARTVDFALVDGDHMTEGVRRDLEDLLGSAAVSRTIILLYGTKNEVVRAGIEAVDFGAHAKVRAIDLDFVLGYLVKVDRFRYEIWGGLGLVVVHEPNGGDNGMHLVSKIAYPISPILAGHRARLTEKDSEPGSWQEVSPDSAGDTEHLRIHTAELERALDTVVRSKSWRVTAPLRRFAARGRSRS